MTRQTANPATPTQWSPQSLFGLIGLIALGVRLVQGWIFWGGASRRMFYDFKTIHGNLHAVKLDPALPGYVANKLVHAMPGSMFPGVIESVIQSGGLLHFLVWFWTLAELVVGVGLILGFATRILSLSSVLLNVSLMLVFGWMGSTCVDEWTMASAGFAMGTLLMLTGGGSWSIDQWWANRSPGLAAKGWFRLMFSGPLPMASVRRWSIWLGSLSMLFTVASYQYLHGAFFSSLHARVNFHHYSLSLSDARADTDGSVRFSAYVNAGPDTGKLYLISAELEGVSGHPVEHWNGKQLSALSGEAIKNTFRQPWASKFKPSAYGIGGVTGAKARIILPGQATLPAGHYTLRVLDIDGKRWQTPVKLR